MVCRGCTEAGVRMFKPVGCEPVLGWENGLGLMTLQTKLAIPQGTSDWTGCAFFGNLFTAVYRKLKECMLHPVERAP